MEETDFLLESEMTDKKDILLCSCYSTEHQMVILYSDDVINGYGPKHPMCYFHIHLNKRPFFERLKYGLMYIFGRKCNYGAFDEFIFNEKDADKLQSVVNYLKKTK